MKYVVTTFLLSGFVLLPCANAQTMAGSLGLFVYPSGGQAVAQQADDEGECFQWAKDATGVDPMNPRADVRVDAPQTGGEGNAAAAGALRGAARAGIIGNLADEDASDWAAAGALVGSIRGARRREAQNAQARQQAESQADAMAQENVETFKKGFTACMEGRDYTVK